MYMRHPSWRDIGLIYEIKHCHCQNKTKNSNNIGCWYPLFFETIQTQSAAICYNIKISDTQQGQQYTVHTRCVKAGRSLLGNGKEIVFLNFISFLNLIWLHLALFEGREEAGVPGENPRWPVKSLTLVKNSCPLRGSNPGPLA